MLVPLLFWCVSVCVCVCVFEGVFLCVPFRFCMCQKMCYSKKYIVKQMPQPCYEDIKELNQGSNPVLFIPMHRNAAGISPHHTSDGLKASTLMHTLLTKTPPPLCRQSNCNHSFF